MKTGMPLFSRFTWELIFHSQVVQAKKKNLTCAVISASLINLEYQLVSLYGVNSNKINPQIHVYDFFALHPMQKGPNL